MQSINWLTSSRRSAASLLLAASALVPAGSAIAQIQTQVERDIASSRAEYQQRRDDVARAQKAQDAAQRAPGGLSEADIARIQGENSRAAAAEARARAAMDAYVAAANQRRTDFLNAEQQKSWLEAVEEFKLHPTPVAAPGSYTECDRLAAEEGDEMRPLGLDGVIEIQIADALVACRAETQRAPQSARARFQLARAMLAGVRKDPTIFNVTCAETLATLRQAGELGSGNAFGTLALLKPSDCTRLEVIAFDKALLSKGANMGHANAGFNLGAVYLNEKLYGNLSDADKAQSVKLMTFAWKYAVSVYARRADAGDEYAIFRLALMADNKYMSYYAFAYVQDPNRWVSRCLVRHIPRCNGFIAKTS